MENKKIDDVLLDAYQIAQMLGGSFRSDHVKAAWLRGEIPFLLINGKRYARQSWIETWLTPRRITPKRERAQFQD